MLFKKPMHPPLLTLQMKEVVRQTSIFANEYQRERWYGEQNKLLGKLQPRMSKHL